VSNPTIVGFDNSDGTFADDECINLTEPQCAKKPGGAVIAGDRVSAGKRGVYVHYTYAQLLLAGPRRPPGDPWLAVPPGCVIDVSGNSATCNFIDLIAVA
jgi:hypothetical protein